VRRTAIRRFADSRKDVLLNPTVIVEVLSKSTANYDRGEKANDYRRLVSLRALVLVASDEPLVESYVRQLPDQWTLTTLRGLGGLLEIPAIGCRLSVADLYGGVEFPPHPTCA
jgi:Uma2 family endonuclease